MHESTIAAVLSGDRLAAELNTEALDSIEQIDSVRDRIRVAPLGRDFAVTSDMIVRMCDAALGGHLEPVALRAVAFAIVTSDAFIWSDDIVGEILHDWSAPEVNLELTPENIKRFRRWAIGSEPYPVRPSTVDTGVRGRVLSETTRVKIRA